MNKYLWSIHLLDAKGIIVNEKDIVLVHMKLEGKRTLKKSYKTIDKGYHKRDTGDKHFT